MTVRVVTENGMQESPASNLHTLVKCFCDKMSSLGVVIEDVTEENVTLRLKPALTSGRMVATQP